MDHSVEQSFFAGTLPSSDYPVSFDVESWLQPVNLEGREQRRAHFKRIVGGIIATLGIGALLALTTRPRPDTLDNEPVVSVQVQAAKTKEAEPPALEAPPPAPIVDIELAPITSVDPAPSASVVARKPSPVTAPRRSPQVTAPAPLRPRVFVVAPPQVGSKPPTFGSTPPAAFDAKPAPPTARFAD